MADFSNFELGTNVAELGDGLIPEMAEVFEVPLSEEPTADELGQLVGVIGKKKTLQDNVLDTKAQLVEYAGSEAAAIALAAQWLDRSGVQKELNRSLWTPDIATPEGAPIVITGSVANWQDRTARLLVGKPPRIVIYAAGNRPMNTETELANENIQAFQDANGDVPTESQYAIDIVAPRLRKEGRHEVLVKAYDTQNGDEIAQRVCEEALDLRSASEVAVARVANAGIQLAIQVRNAMRSQNANFDISSQSPGMYVMTDTFEIARTVKETQDAPHYQNPFTGIRQVALTAKLLTEAAG